MRGTFVLLMPGFMTRKEAACFKGHFFFRAVKDECIIISARGVCENFLKICSML